MAVGIAASSTCSSPLANEKRDDLLKHQHVLEELVQKHSLVPVPIVTPNPRCLSIFLCIAQAFKSNAADFLDAAALANQIREATYQQIKSNFDLYEKYIRFTSSDKAMQVDIRRDSQWLIDSNYYRYQLERPILFALAHVLRCNLIVFSSAASDEQQPDVIHSEDASSNGIDQVLVLLKNESTQRFTSARTTCKPASMTHFSICQSPV